MYKSPYDDVATGKAGLPAKALVQWDEIEPGKRIHEYRRTKAEFLVGTYSEITYGVDNGHRPRLNQS